jgi:acyl-CoA reductase-like NAD-dependent aldehyde dehydrogenase
VGQFCTNPGLVILEERSETFLKKLASLMEATPSGTMLTAGICAAFHAGVERIARTPGVRRLAFGKAAAGGQAAPALFATDAGTFLRERSLMEEVFGPCTLVVECAGRDALLSVARQLEGQITATIHANPEELQAGDELLSILETKAGRLVCNGFPTGVEVCHAMSHGGPYPATSDGRSTSVGSRALTRFLRPVCYQGFPADVLQVR